MNRLKCWNQYHIILYLPDNSSTNKHELTLRLTLKYQLQKYFSPPCIIHIMQAGRYKWNCTAGLIACARVHTILLYYTRDLCDVTFQFPFFIFLLYVFFLVRRYIIITRRVYIILYTAGTRLNGGLYIQTTWKAEAAIARIHVHLRGGHTCAANCRVLSQRIWYTYIIQVIVFFRLFI